MAESAQSVSKLSATEIVENANKFNKTLANELSQHIKKRSHTAKTRQILSPRQMQKLIKNEGPVFLVVVRTSNDLVLNSAFC